jgi:uncharacterized Ntn-hydrolase superfamily protein
LLQLELAQNPVGERLERDHQPIKQWQLALGIRLHSEPELPAVRGQKPGLHQAHPNLQDGSRGRCGQLSRVHSEGAVIGTYSIAACDLPAGQWGVAVQSRFLAVGAFVPWATAGVGAIAVQAYTSPSYGPAGIALLRAGASSDQVLERLLAADAQASVRQLGVVDASGAASSHTGSDCFPWAGGITGNGFAAQGNILVSSATVEALAATFESSSGQRLPDRLLRCLDAAESAGGDRRGRQSAALLVVEQGAGYDGWDVLVDLRVDDHPQPLRELRRLYDVHQILFGTTPTRAWVTVDEQLRLELAGRLTRLGFSGDLGQQFIEWANMENLEERIDGIDRVDPVVLAELRKRS